jgi:hypothetical protein
VQITSYEEIKGGDCDTDMENVMHVTGVGAGRGRGLRTDWATPADRAMEGTVFSGLVCRTSVDSRLPPVGAVRDRFA